MADDELILVLSGILKPFFYLMKQIKGFENYLINKDGEIFSKFTKTKITSHKDKNGYYRIRLVNEHGRKSVFIHRLLAMTFIPNPENKPCVNHIDCNKSNNDLSNLEWVTQQENIKHAWDNNKCYKSYETVKLAHKVTSKKLLDTNTNTIFNSISEAIRYYKIPSTTFYRLMNKTNQFKLI
jgi:hypothetical protein